MEISIAFPTDTEAAERMDRSRIEILASERLEKKKSREICAIVAMALDGAIGQDGDMPWHISADLKRFKALTMGHPVIMGRATWLSLPRRPLPGRRNIVLSRNPDFKPEGAEKAASVEEAVTLCPPDDIPFFIGGANAFREAMPIVTRVYLTLVNADFPDADTRLPLFSSDEWKEISRDGPYQNPDGLQYEFIELHRL